MRILFVNDYQEKVGGTEVYLESLADHLKQLGHEVRFYSGSNSYLSSVKNKKKLTSFLNRFFSIPHYFKFGTVINEFKPDVIHLQNIFNEVSPSILLRTGNVPVIMTLHDNFLVQAVFDQMMKSGPKCKKEICPGCPFCVGVKGMIYEKIKRAFHKVLLKKVKVFIAPSKYIQNVISSNSEYRPIQIYNGFALPKPLPFLSNFSALYIGRLTDDKGVDTLIEAVPTILKMIPSFTLSIAGEGMAKEKLIKRVVELKIQTSVKFFGQLNKKQIVDRLSKASILVVPSNWPENLPTVCIEALSVGKPVVATRVGGIPEIVTDNVNGYLVPPNSPSDLSETIVKLLSNESRLKNFSKNAITGVEKFNIDDHVAKIISIYQEVALRT